MNFTSATVTTLDGTTIQGAITITPHVARRIDAGELVPNICGSIRALQAGRALAHLIDRKRGY